jgi:hypothetical protein
MRKSLMATLIGGAFAFSGQAHAGLTLDLNGAAGGGVIQATALDWSQTSFLAQGGNTAIAAFALSGGACPNNLCSFEVLTHAKLTGYTPVGGGAPVSLPGGFGEITMVARYTETVTNFIQDIDPGTAGDQSFASFRSTGAGWLEFYYSGAADADDLSGAGFNNGTLIGRLDGVAAGRTGNFTVTDVTPVALDGFGANNYNGQQSISGFGSQQSLKAGTTGVDLDSNFFLTELIDFSIVYDNISIGVPYTTANPSHCFTQNASVSAVGTGGQVSSCDNLTTNGLFSANSVGGGFDGYLADIGSINGLGLRSADFVAQTDFNSAVTGTVPEPGSLALVGLALASVGFAARSRRRS